MNHKYLERSNTNPGAIISTDTSGLDRYKKAKLNNKNMVSKIETLENRLRKLEELLTK